MRLWKWIADDVIVIVTRTVRVKLCLQAPYEAYIFIRACRSDFHQPSRMQRLLRKHHPWTGTIIAPYRRYRGLNRVVWAVILVHFPE